jgi:hypothetical protein
MIKSKLHQQILDLLDEIFPAHTICTEYPYANFLKKNPNPLLRAVAKQLRADIYDITMGIIYEIQGIQHYEPVEFFGGDKAFYSQKVRDRYKEQIIMETGKKLVLIPYDFEVNKVNLLELING